ncbi:hypothetical protein [Azospirillum thermophilum]|uniref:Uncharacterized protein n=1 Tax=Azospirillum thermophilum TaxID=2202148 RepID=A0A2S2CKV2_9PROT|nr:hypothetical protein [Azospirillum thermophilum]AWK85059.1 hypothetical protein DEW08_01645 [Azospirillum thermophilum]
MIRRDDIPDDLGHTLAVVMSAKLDAYKAQYRAMVASRLVEIRDGYEPGSPEHKVLDAVLRRIGAAPRNPEA